MQYKIKNDFSNSGCKICVIQDLNDWKSENEDISVFLHSANYKFSLGSGSSLIVQQMIDGEKLQHGVSKLEKAIQKIKKTPICGVKLTQGGYLPQTFELPGLGDRMQTCLNFNGIVHAVIPGPRIDDFEKKVEKMIGEVLQEISYLCFGGDKVDFLMPVVGVNNFGYPFEFMWNLYLRLLKTKIDNGELSGKISILLRKHHIELLLKSGEITLEGQSM
jgi:hypothetical protein